MIWRQQPVHLFDLASHWLHILIIGVNVDYQKKRLLEASVNICNNLLLHIEILTLYHVTKLTPQKHEERERFWTSVIHWPSSRVCRHKCLNWGWVAINPWTRGTKVANIWLECREYHAWYLELYISTFIRTNSANSTTRFRECFEIQIGFQSYVYRN